MLNQYSQVMSVPSLLPALATNMAARMEIKKTDHVMAVTGWQVQQPMVRAEGYGKLAGQQRSRKSATGM